MAVEPDKYELPIAVADTAEQLGKMIGISRSGVITSELYNMNGKNSGRKIVKVKI